MSNDTTKQAFASWLTSQPGCADYYGADKINQWANGVIFSKDYDDMYNLYSNGQMSQLLQWIKIHVNPNIPAWTAQSEAQKENVYGAVIDYLQRIINTQSDYLANLQASGSADDNPVAIGIIEQDINALTERLNYYTLLQKSVPP